MPQFDFTTYSSQIFWFFICFSALYLVMSRVILPRIHAVLSNRKSVIDADLNLGKELDEKISALHSKTLVLRQEASQKYQSKLEEVTKQASRQREAMLDDLKSKLDASTKKSRLELASFIEKSRAKSDLAAANLAALIKQTIFKN